jgi:hypothetical protein
MSKLLKIDDIVERIENATGRKVWLSCVVGLGAPIENTDFHEVHIYIITCDDDVRKFKQFFKNVLNVVEITFVKIKPLT